MFRRYTREGFLCNAFRNIETLLFFFACIDFHKIVLRCTGSTQEWCSFRVSVSKSLRRSTQDEDIHTETKSPRKCFVGEDPDDDAFLPFLKNGRARHS